MSTKNLFKSTIPHLIIIFSINGALASGLNYFSSEKGAIAIIPSVTESEIFAKSILIASRRQVEQTSPDSEATSS